jgi:hypothetical protein
VRTLNVVGRVALRRATALALAISLAGCASEHAGSSGGSVADTKLPAPSGAATAGDPDACTHVDAPMLDIPTVDESEPQMRIPQPPGWERNNELDNLDETLRFTVAETDLVAHERPQNVAVVSLTRVPIPDGDADAQTILNGLRGTLVQMLDEKGLPTDLTTTATTICGLPAQTLTYAGTAAGLGAMTVQPSRPVTVLQVLTKVGGQTYTVGVTTTTEPDNPKYRRDADMILTGFQVLPPTATNP